MNWMRKYQEHQSEKDMDQRHIEVQEMLLENDSWNELLMKRLSA